MHPLGLGLLYQFFPSIAGDHDNPRLRSDGLAGVDSLRCLDTVHARHVPVHQHEITGQPGGLQFVALDQPCGDGDIARLGKFDGLVGQIDPDLVEAQRIALEDLRYEVQDQLQALLAGFHADGIGAVSPAHDAGLADLLLCQRRRGQSTVRSGTASDCTS
jgi:hypothetical protein